MNKSKQSEPNGGRKINRLDVFHFVSKLIETKNVHSKTFDDKLFFTNYIETINDEGSALFYS